jgi:nucleoside-diphosphate-sugar epimerase
MTDQSSGRLLTITGAAGRIGTFYRQHLRDQGTLGNGPGQWRLRLVDVRQPQETQPDDDVQAGEQEGNLAELEVARRALKGAHSVLHLAADPSPRADFYASLLDRNIKATYNVLHAAHELGVKRVVFASSVNAILGYPRDVQVRAEDVAWPGNVYGASKAWGEAICGAFVAQSEGRLSAIAVRIGGVTDRERVRARADRTGEWQSITVTHEDLCRLFDCCLNGAPDVTFAVVNGISANRFLRMDLDSTRRKVGYRPQDDAFAIAESAATGPAENG